MRHHRGRGVRSAWGGLLCLGILLLSAAAWAQPAAYLRSTVGPPWDATTNEAAMDRVFEPGNWADLRYENALNVDPNLFSTQLPLQRQFIFMEGSDTNAEELEAFLNTNRAAIENWVSAGGRLFLNAAPNEGDGMDFGFGGVTLVYPSFSDNSVAFDAFHPIFGGPFTPVGTSYTGFSFARAELTGGGTTTVMTGDQARVVLAEKAFGSGRVLFGGMTTDNFHSPQPDAANLRANIIAYAADRVSSNEIQTLTGGGPGASNWFVANFGGTDNGLPTSGFCASTPGLTVFDASLGNQGDAFDNGLTLWVNDAIFVAPPIVTRLGQTYTAGPVTMAGLNVTMQYYAASQSGTLRTFVSFENPSGSPITVTIKWLTNVGSDGATQVVGSSSGDTAVTPADRWVVTSDGGPFDPVNTHVLFGPGSPPVPPSVVSQVVFSCAGTQGIFAQYDLQGPAGQTRALLFFNQLNPSQDTALANAATFETNSLPGDLLAGLGPAERGQIANWQLATAPDLVVQSIVLDPPSPIVGEPVTVTVTARNQGGADATFFFVDFYKDRTTPPGLFEFGDVACSFGGVAVNATVQCLGTVTYDSVGTFQAWAQVDADGIVAESNEANNVLGPQAVIVQGQIPPGPDLVIDSVKFLPAAPVTGQPLTVTVVVRNRGASAAGPFDTDIYPDRGDTPPVVGQLGPEFCSFNSLAAGATDQCTRNVTYFGTGSFKLWALADSFGALGSVGQVDETPNENNNTFGPVAITVVDPPAGPDLVVDSIVLNPTVPIVGEQASVTVTGRNRGGQAAGPFYIDFYQDRGTAPGLGEFGNVACFFEQGLGPGQTIQCNGSVVYDTPDTFQAWSQIDADGIVQEPLEDNNVVGPQTVRVQARLTASKAGAGSGTVTSQPAGINCGNACQVASATYDAGQDVVLTANPAQGSTFSGWTGACSGTGTCQVTMSGNVSVTANFALAGGAQQFTLTVQKSGSGSGTVTSSNVAGINCGPDCSEIYVSGTQVTLTASAGPGSIFTGWSGGGCSGTGQCTVTLTTNTLVTATFAQQVTLTISTSGTGSGTVTATVNNQPAGITCGFDCSEAYASGTQVTLSAVASPGSNFAGWSGGGCSGTGQCVLTLGANTTVTASFGGTAIRPMAYLRSTVGGPWGTLANEFAMDAAFGAGNWDDLRYETVNPLALFNPERRFVFMEGSDQNADELELFLTNNRQAIEAWVGSGGRLLLNAAPNEGDGMDYGFESVALVYPFYADQVEAADANHPIFQGPLTPVGTQFSGNSFAHAHVTGGGVVPLIRAANGGPVVLAQKVVGSGLVLFGGMTTDNFHSPQPNATNLRANILTYAAFTNVGVRPFVYLRSTVGAPWGAGANEAAMNAIFGGGNWDDLRYETVNVGSLFSTQLPLQRQFIFMEGSDSNAQELEDFLNANRTAIEDWVFAGGRLFLNAAPNEGDGMSFGFGGVTLNFDLNGYSTASDTGTAVDASHPIFQGPLTPVGTQFTGGFFTHAHVSGGSVTPLIADGLGRTALGQLPWGTGLVLFGGMTTDNLHAPQPEAANLRANILSYTATATLAAATLSVSKTGNGTGTVTSQPAGINCGGECTAVFAGGTPVTLTAAQDPDSIFNGWSGACSGTGPCQLTLTTNTSVTATFTRVNNPQFLLSVTRTGSGTGTVTGTVNGQPAGITCGVDCTELYDGGTQVTLTATPNSGASFAGWSGHVSCTVTPQNPVVTITMDANKTCTATFTQQVTLTVQKAGQGTGTVTTDVGGINCGPACNSGTAGFTPGTAVTLTAAATQNSQFEGWSGGGCAGTDPCTVTLTQNTTVTATFRRLFTISVTLAGTGDGSVISFPQAGISCPQLACAGVYVEGTLLALIPVIPSGSAFLGFSQNCRNGLVTVTQDTQCSAEFVELGALPASLGFGGAPANGSSENPTLSANGRFLAFDSDASNLDAQRVCVGGIVRQVFVLDLDTGIITCVSVGPNGPGNLHSTRPSISADGRFVAFQSEANDLVLTGCIFGGIQAFVRDRQSGTTTCVSVTPSGLQGNADSERPVVSSSGRFVAFETLADLVEGCGGTRQIVVRDLQLGVTSCVSVGPGGVAGNGPSASPSINQDGRVIAFRSNASNLVATGCNQGGPASQIFVRDLNLQPATTLCISVSTTGTPGNAASVTPSISANGRVLAFASLATNLVPVGDPEQPAGCTNGPQHIFRHDRDDGPNGDTDCISVAPNGNPGDASSFEAIISGNGNIIVFRSAAGNLVEAAPSAALTLGQGAPTLAQPVAALSVDQVMRSDAVAQAMTQMSQSGGVSGNGPSRNPTTNFDGMVVAFQSQATNLMSNDTNDGEDVFVVRPTPIPPPPPGPSFVLRVVTAGSGSGTVTSTPAGISCPADCQEPYAQGTAVTLRARAAVGSLFTGWSGGGCSGAGDCLVTVTAAAQVTATFEPTAGVVLTLRVLGGAGTVTSEPPGLTCPPTCTAAFGPGTAVTLTAAVTVPGGTFGGFAGGGCAGPSPCVVTLTDPVEVTARFAPAGRVVLTSPSDGAHFPGGPTQITFTWTTVPGVSLYGLEHTGPNLLFHNPNGSSPDPVSGFGGAGNAFLIPNDASVTVSLDVSSLPPGLYQIRVIPLLPGPTVPPGATFSDAITVRLGPLGSEQPRLTSPPDRTVLVRGATPVLLTWTPVSGAADYLLEVSAANLPFTNPEGLAPDPQNGFGGTGLGFLIPAITVGPLTVPTTVAPGTYQVRVLPRAPSGEFIGRASPAISLEIQ